MAPCPARKAVSSPESSSISRSGAAPGECYVSQDDKVIDAVLEDVVDRDRALHSTGV